MMEKVADTDICFHREIQACVLQTMLINTLSCITMLLLLKYNVSYCCSATATINELNWSLKSNIWWKIALQYHIGSAMFIGLKILSNIGYRNIGQISYRCNTT